LGTEAFWIPAAIAAVSAGAQYANTTQANKRQDQSEAQAIQNQQAIRQKGEAEVNKTVQDVAKSNPNQIAGQATAQYVDQLRRNAAGSSSPGVSSALAPVAGGSSRYNADKATAQQAVESYGNTKATEMGDLDAAVRQRQNEGLEMSTLNTNLNTLGAQSYAQNFVDQLRSSVAGQTNPLVSLFAGLGANTAGFLSRNPQFFGTSSLAPGSIAPQTINGNPNVAGGGSPYNA
jgi:hypothetical protein